MSTKSVAQAQRPLIVVVDDDITILGLLDAFLPQNGFDTWLATSAAMAVAMLHERDRQPDLAILDIHIPGMSGLQLAAMLRQDTAIPFMFLTADDTIDTARHAAASGAVGFLVKPLELNQVLPAVMSALARAGEIKTLKRQEVSLVEALHAGRENGVAVGILMERHQINQQQAFELLREQSRSTRVKIATLAATLVSELESALVTTPDEKVE